MVESCANINTVGITKQKANGQNQSNKLINYFYSSKYTEADKRESNAMMQKIHNVYSDIFTGIGCFKGTFSLQLKQQAIPNATKACGICYRNHLRRNWSGYKNWTS